MKLKKEIRVVFINKQTGERREASTKDFASFDLFETQVQEMTSSAQQEWGEVFVVQIEKTSTIGLNLSGPHDTVPGKMLQRIRELWG